jgi:hypothetical protein
MSLATPKMRAFSRRLIAHETKRNQSSGTERPAIFPVIEKLRPTLATLMGTIGFGALLSRALVLTNAENTGLRAVHVKADGTFEGLDRLGTHADSAEIAVGKVVLLAQLLGLLVAFIGDDMTLRLLRDVWPKLSLNDLDLGAGDANEEAN